ncbi:hypothetical protein BCU94_04325 [Shewanella sp. 10N.286.52.C2]|uniref:acyltransferase family protein n=1 Tax=unclassified Shewanella TaxID=196818 RepID=UPI000C817D33|nr:MULTISPECIES: acyltransferase [unclassified Shewanella]MDO6619790.1 acyltransferase [Shewanella sp. 6_MG-2023]MDO6676996.1 acyltransferase [Shewanella sp. 4_MG-2023]PMG27592.1 hypothetical protein BCU94_04325 [Shewanella sp. 10N.286.52.C2]
MLASRKLEIDTLRGLACILLVSYHVIGSSSTQGMRIDSGVLRDINDVFIYIRMPLFSFLSGLIYGMRPLKSNFIPFLKKKTARLLYPMLTVGTLFALLQFYVPGTNRETINFWLMHIIPVDHYWFLEAIFLVFCLVTLFEFFNLLNSYLTSVFILVLSIVIYLLGVDVNYLSLDGFFYLLPFFLFGMMNSRFPSAVQKMLTVSLAILVSYGLSLYFDFDDRALRIGIGFSFCFTLFLLKIKMKWLSYIGVYSFSIYLFHVFFTASSRIFLNYFDVLNTSLVFMVGLTAGIAGSIVIDKLLSSNSWMTHYVLGR